MLPAISPVIVPLSRKACNHATTQANGNLGEYMVSIVVLMTRRKADMHESRGTARREFDSPSVHYGSCEIGIHRMMIASIVCSQ